MNNRGASLVDVYKIGQSKNSLTLLPCRLGCLVSFYAHPVTLLCMWLAPNNKTFVLGFFITHIYMHNKEALTITN